MAQRIHSTSKNQIYVLPRNILENVCNFLKIHEVALNVHFVCRDWRPLKQNDGCLVLRDSSINIVGLQQLLGQYKDRTIVSLDAERCKNLVNEALKVLKDLRSLTALNLTSLPIDDQGIEHLSSLSLSHLNINWINITDKGMATFSKMPLNSLSLIDCTKITQKGLDPFSQHALTRFHSNQASSLEFLRKMPIRELSISDTYLSYEQMQYISKMPLKKLYLDTDRICENGLKLLPLSLTHLSLGWCNGLSSTSFQPLCSLVNLTFLDLSYTPHADEALEPLSNLRIKFLNLSTCQGISDSSLTHLNHTLEGINLTRCKTITNRAVEILSKHPLRYLNLTSCNISDEGIQFLSTVPLRHLILKSCSQLTDKTLTTTEKMCLIELDLRDCSGMTNPDAQSKLPEGEGPDINFLNKQR